MQVDPQRECGKIVQKMSTEYNPRVTKNEKVYSIQLNGRVCTCAHRPLCRRCGEGKDACRDPDGLALERCDDWCDDLRGGGWPTTR